MESFVCILCPAVVSFLLFEKFSKKKFDLKYSLFIYLIFVMVIYAVSLVACKKKYDLFASPIELTNSPAFALKFLLISTLIGAVFGVVMGWLYGNVKLSIVIKKEKKKNGKTKKRS